MLEVTSYGLTGLVATLVVAFCFAFSEDLAPRKEEFSLDRIKNTHLPGSSVPNETLAAAGSRDRVPTRSGTKGSSTWWCSTPSIWLWHGWLVPASRAL